MDSHHRFPFIFWHLGKWVFPGTIAPSTGGTSPIGLARQQSADATRAPQGFVEGTPRSDHN